MKDYQPRSLLVTGGAGFIGTNFIRHVLLTDEKIKIINLDKLTYAGSLANLMNLPHPERHHFIQGDIADNQLVTRILKEYHIDTIVHFAAESHVDRSITNPASFVNTNIIGTFSLLEAAHQCWLKENHWNETLCRFHHISTDEVYGSLDLHDPAFTEKTPYQPRSPYAASKASADHLVSAYYHTYGLPITISHCTNNYGPYQHREKFVPTIIHACLENKSIPIYGSGKNIRDWLYVEDHCSGIMTILKYGIIGERYNLGGNTEVANIELANYICEQMDLLFPQQKSYKRFLEFVTDRPGHDFRYATNFHKVKQLGWLHSESLTSGINKTIQFYKNNINVIHDRTKYAKMN